MYNSKAFAAIPIASKEHFREELNHIAFYGDKIEATNAYMAIRIKNDDEHHEPILVPAVTLDAIKKAKADMFSITKTDKKTTILYHSLKGNIPAGGIESPTCNQQFPTLALDSIFPTTEPSFSVQLNAKLLITCLESLQKTSGNKDARVMFNLYEKTSPITMSTINPKNGTIDETAIIVLMPTLYKPSLPSKMAHNTSDTI